MTKEEIKELLESDEYSFLKTDKRLGDNIALLVLGGSKAYGTNLPTSDTDIRGFAINPPEQIYGLAGDFEQVVETNTDTTIYSLNKMVKLLTSCNPNTIEILGCRPEDYLFIDEYGQMILDNKTNFLSVKAIDTFGGYARAQFNRLEHALLGNGELDNKKLEMLKHSLDCSIESFNIKHRDNRFNVKIKILTDEETKDVLKTKLYRYKAELETKLETDLLKAETEPEKQSLRDLHRNNIDKIENEYNYKISHLYECIDERIVISGIVDDMPVELVQDILRDIHKIKSEYGNINKRNTKKDEIHLAKHMMHLIRLYMMGTKLNECMDIHTHWDGKELELLMDIRHMKYMTPDGKQVLPEFYELLTDIEKKYDYSVRNTILPSEPNYAALNEMLHSIYSKKFIK